VVAGDDVGEGVKVGLRSVAPSVARSADENENVSRGTAPPSSGRSVDALFVDRANQLFVAAIACRTAWRPLSSMLVAGDADSLD
jgi:hypothetical protein